MGTDSVGPPLRQAHGREAAVVNSFVPGVKSKEEISDTANQGKNTPLEDADRFLCTVKTAGWAKAALTKGEMYSFWPYSTLWAILEHLLPPPLSLMHTHC